MIEYKLKPITDTSWILHNNGERLAMIVSTNTGYNAIGQLKIKSFKTLEELEATLGGKVTIEEVAEDKEPEEGDVDGYPIKHATSADIKNEAYPSYSKIKDSNLRFAAGYYGVLFSHGWVNSFCPKTTTLEENKWIGPFRTKLEMRNAISQQKNAPKV
jgi:hypothetical protein